MSQPTIEGFELSARQRSLWLRREREGRDPVSGCLRPIDGEVDAGRLREALAREVARHEVLRTVYRRVPGMAFPLQVVTDSGAGWAEERGGSADEVFGRCLDESWDLERGPVLRAVLVRLDGGGNALVLTAPALTSDPEGLALLARRVTGGAGAEDEEPLQYIDFAEFQSGELAGDGADEERAFWRSRLAAEAPAPALAGPPAEEPGPVRAGAVRERMDAAGALRELARETGAEPHALCLAAWRVLLWRLGADGEAAVAVELDGRHHPELAGLPGPYTRALPVVVSIRPGEPLRREVERTADELEAIAAFQDAFDPGALDGAPWSPDYVFAWRGDGGEPGVRRAGSPEPFVARLECALASDGLLLTLEHDPRRLGREEARRLLGRYRALLASALAAPDRRVSQLDALTDEDRRDLARLARGETAGVPEPERIDRLVARQAGRTPDAVALVYEGEHVTFRELMERADRLAGRLRRAGVGPEVAVGIRAARSVELVVALLAVWRAGGHYLPLDPSYPAERLAFMVADTRPAVLLVAPASGGSVAAAEVRTLPLPPGAGRGTGAPEAPEGGEDRLDDLAYVLYTSGSTGRPKGVMVPHRAIANRLLWMQTATPLAAGDRVVQKTPASFDASIWELFTPLLAGATVELARPEGSGDMAYLAELVAERRVTVLQLVPSLFRLFLATAAARRCVDLRRVFCGGEPLARDLADRLAALLPGAALHNLYGPTETAIDATWQPLDGAAGDGAGSPVVPIGRPIARLSAHVMDPWGRPPPPGAPGELWVAGPSVARGYLGRPARTAERFVPDPEGEAAGGRAYRTGDLVRWRADGRLEFLGRLDRQVKLQGVRIEPSEVEAALLEHPSVREAVVEVREWGGERRLVAYLTAAGEAPGTPAELRRHLESLLPAAMLPAAYVVCPRLPRTPSGKIDRAALPEPAVAESAESEAAAAPEAITRELLANIWRELLGVERIGPRDDFFGLGGHSLLATRLVSRLRKAFGVEVSMRQIFDSPTLAGLAAAIERGRRGDRRELPPLRPVARDRPLPLSFSQRRLWFLDQLDPGSPAYDIPFGVRLAGEIDLPALVGGLRTIVARHEALRTRFPSREGRPVQEVVDPFHLPAPVVDVAALPEGARERAVGAIARAEARWSFDLSRGPLVRVVVLRRAGDDHVLLANLHHIVSDGWSTGLVLRELSELYRAARAGRPADLPELPVQYADFAVWQHQALAGEALEGLIEHWRERLAGRPPTLGLPTDRPRPEVPTPRGGRRPLALPGALVRRLEALARERDATLFMVVLAGLDALLLRYSGQNDVVVGSPVAGRTLVETEPLIGFFANTLVLRTGLDGGLPFADALGRVRETALEASAHQDLPFEKLVEVLQPERDVRRPPLVEVVLAFQAAATERFEMPGLRLEPLRTGTGGAKFDLVFDLRIANGPDAGLVGGIEYAADLFDPTTVDRMGRHLETLLAAAAASPERALADLSLLGAAERHQLVREWSPVHPAATGSGGLRAAFREQAGRTPDAVAVVAGGRSLSYGDLARRARALAGELRRAGVGTETRVGLFAERTEALVVGLLAVIEAGGVYVPIDPVYPADHVRFVLEDSAAPVLLTEGVEPPAVPGVRTIAISAAAGSLPEPAAPEPPAEAAAYVIYTSGSTGRQKGVAVSHRSVLRLFDTTRAGFRFGPDEVWSLFHSIAFDFSVWELWGALLHGGRVVVVPWIASRSPEAFAALAARERVTMLSQTPSAFAQLAAVDAGGAGGGLPDLRHVVFGGEALDPSSLGPWFARHGDESPRLVNMYGITETTVHVTWRSLSAADAAAGNGSSIGRPIPDLALWVVDPAGRPAPVGVAGELWVGGAGVARGYLGRPALTAERFLPDPFGRRPGGRVYRSGDLARARPGGEVEYLGRIDHQVKVRGFRIELGEIEARLSTHADVGEAAVVARGTGADVRLLAYVTPAAGAAPGPGALRSFLAERLPRHMVPAAVVVLDSLPLTPNGKLDRRALPEPDGVRPDLAGGYRAPRTPVEEVIAGIWSEVLELDRVGVEDDFFELGGHSLQATQVVARLRQRFRTELPLRHFFGATTVAALSDLVTEREERPGGAEKLARLLLRVERMSAEEVKDALSQRDREKEEYV